MEEVLAILQEGDIDRAIETLRAYTTDGSSAVFDFTLGNLYFQEQRIDDALHLHGSGSLDQNDGVQGKSIDDLAAVGGPFEPQRVFGIAREALGKVRQMLDQRLPNAKPSELHNWLIPQILADEAEGLLNDEGDSSEAERTNGSN